MEQSLSEKKIKALLKLADIEVNGSRPWDIKVHNSKLYTHVLAGGSLALGESYMNSWWDVDSLDQFFYKILNARLNEAVKDDRGLIFQAIKSKIFNSQKVSRAFQIGEKHYDVDDSVYEAMLDENRTYTCGYWTVGISDLASAQNAKLDLICQKLKLKKGDRVLDIGCGWGSFARYAATYYGVSVVGITVSKNQAEYAKKVSGDLPVEFRLQDYRSINEKFDAITSVGMFEHVGVKNYKTYMEVVRKSLKDDGLFLLHTIGGNKSVKQAEPWIGKYIFTNSMLPSIAQIGASIEKIFVMEDWHNFSSDYDKTLMAWHKNFMDLWVNAGEKRDERFVRMWRYYLLSCAASFRVRNNQLWQIVFSPHGVKSGYKSIR